MHNFIEVLAVKEAKKGYSKALAKTYKLSNMSFKVLHRGYQHIRLSSSFHSPWIFKTIFVPWRDEKGIESIQFYMDQQHFTLRIKEGFSVLDNAEAF